MFWSPYSSDFHIFGLKVCCGLWPAWQEFEAEGKGPGGGVLPYMGHIGMCRCEGYGFQAVYASIGYINQRVWV